MSYTNSTTHYGFPLPLGTDLTVPMDYNQAMNDIDEHLFDAETDASTAATAAANAVETANGAAADVADLGTTVNAHDGRLTSLEQHDIVQDNKIDTLETSTGIKFDSVGIADAYINGLTYAVGDIVTYNGQRYKCITAVTAAEPFDSDKWQGEDVQTVLDNINSDLAVKIVEVSENITLRVSGKICVLNINGAQPTGGVFTGTISEEYRPALRTDSAGRDTTDANICGIYVATDGVIHGVSASGSNLSAVSVLGSITWIIN